MTRQEIEALLAKAERVTPGPVYIVGLLQGDDEQFVAACSPDVIAALCRRALEAETAQDELATCCLCEYEFDEPHTSTDRGRQVVCASCWPHDADARGWKRRAERAEAKAATARRENYSSVAGRLWTIIDHTASFRCPITGRQSWSKRSNAMSRRFMPP